MERCPGYCVRLKKRRRKNCVPWVCVYVCVLYGFFFLGLSSLSLLIFNIFPYGTWIMIIFVWCSGGVKVGLWD